MRNLRDGIATQRRVVGALLIREIYARFGREGLGFGWIIDEPLIFALPVLLVWSAVRDPYEHGMPLMPMLWTGYLPLAFPSHRRAHAAVRASQRRSLISPAGHNF
jgi:capsular polysaccharide transport system permease protein